MVIVGLKIKHRILLLKCSQIKIGNEKIYSDIITFIIKLNNLDDERNQNLINNCLNNNRYLFLTTVNKTNNINLIEKVTNEL